MIERMIAMAVPVVAVVAVAGPVLAQDGRPERTEQAAAMFDRMDADKDGMISRAEWDSARAVLAERRGRQGRDGWASVDRDADGRLSAAEWQAAGRPAERFQKMDADRNGILTRAEAMAARQARQAETGR